MPKRCPQLECAVTHVYPLKISIVQPGLNGDFLKGGDEFLFVSTVIHMRTYPKAHLS